jgi:hypothetical protein
VGKVSNEKSLEPTSSVEEMAARAEEGMQWSQCLWVSRLETAE